MNIWITSDQHWNHKNIIGYCNRPFSSVEEMNEEMIDRWNEMVSNKDEVYHLGDLSLSGIEYVFPLLRRLNGLIKIVPGGHDSRWISEYKEYQIFMPDKLWILEPVFNKTFFMDKYVTMCHHAMRVWDRSHHGSYHFYGHSHGNLPPLGKSIDVGVDTNNFYPYLLSEALEKIDEHS